MEARNRRLSDWYGQIKRGEIKLPRFRGRRLDGSASEFGGDRDSQSSVGYRSFSK